MAKRSGGKSKEFSGSRNVNTMGGKSSSTLSSPLSKVGASRTKSPTANLGNTYGITARGGGVSSGGSAYGAGRGNALFGSGGARSSSGAAPPRRTGRRGGKG